MVAFPYNSKNLGPGKDSQLGTQGAVWLLREEGPELDF